MKTVIVFFTFLYLLTSTFGNAQKEICEKPGDKCPNIDFRELVLIDKIYYKKFTDIPFTGNVFGQQRGFIKKGNPTGPWTEFHNNGTIKIQGVIKNKIWDGAKFEYYDNGQLHYKSFYKNRKKEGPYILYYRDGTLEGNINYKNGKKDGPFEIFYDNGQLRFKGNFINGLEEGTLVSYYKDGKLHFKHEYKKGLLEGYSVTYLEDGTIDKIYTGIFKNNEKISDQFLIYTVEQYPEIKINRTYLY